MSAILDQLWEEITSAPEQVQAEVLDFLVFVKSRSGNPGQGGAARIRHTAGVCGGAACVGDTRIAVWMLEEARRAGVTDAGLLQDYPGIDAVDLAAAWAYVESHAGEIEAAIHANNTL
jgi:uncharacterized protein (DUF433 family)